MNELLAGGRLGPSSPTVRRRGFFLRLCTANPFYAISAVLVFVGLRASFDTHGAVFPSWSLLAALAGYTLLLAGMAVLLVRFGNVWDDIRTLLLLVVLMFLVISVAFDEILSRDPGEGVMCCFLGLVFASLLSEGLLRGLRLRLPARFRVPYHLGLALFFAYPAAISPWLRSPDDPGLLWAIFGFAPAAGLVTLTLLPASRTGPGYLRDNGSPWPWPLYPWVVFGVLGFGACARSYYLGLSAQASGAPGYYESYLSTVFGPYFLVPLGLAVASLLLEAGLARRSARLANIAMLAPGALVVLALVGHQPFPVYRRFLGLFADTLGGTPAFVTLFAVALFYGVAALRRVPHAWDGLTATAVGLAFVGPATLTLGDLGPIHPAPLGVAATIQLALTVRRRDSLRALLVAIGFGAAFMATPAVAGWSPTLRAIAIFHLAIAASMAIGAAFDDPLARVLRPLGAAFLLLAATEVALVGPRIPIAPEVTRFYPVAVGVIAAAYGWLVPCPAYLVVAALSLTGGLALVAWRAYATLRRLVVGLDQIAWGLLSFLVAAAISLTKAGAIQGWWARRRTIAKPCPTEGLDGSP